jgi:hypothetical protein
MHKKNLCPSIGDINWLMMMMMIQNNDMKLTKLVKF